MTIPKIKEETVSVVGVVSCLKSIPGVRPWTEGGQAMLPASPKYKYKYKYKYTYKCKYKCKYKYTEGVARNVFIKHTNTLGLDMKILL